MHTRARLVEFDGGDGCGDQNEQSSHAMYRQWSVVQGVAGRSVWCGICGIACVLDVFSQLPTVANASIALSICMTVMSTALPATLTQSVGLAVWAFWPIVSCGKCPATNVNELAGAILFIHCADDPSCFSMPLRHRFPLLRPRYSSQMFNDVAQKVAHWRWIYLQMLRSVYKVAAKSASSPRRPPSHSERKVREAAVRLLCTLLVTRPSLCLLDAARTAMKTRRRRKSHGHHF